MDLDNERPRVSGLINAFNRLKIVMPPPKRAKKSTPKSHTRSLGASTSSQHPEECFRNYIFKVLREIYDDTGITKQAMHCMNTIVNQLFHFIAAEASSEMRKAGRTCMSAHDVQNAVRKLLPGELEKHAVSEGTKAVAKYKNFQSE